MRTIRIVFGVCALLASANSACAQAPAEPDGLIWGTDAHPDVAVLPRLIGEGAARINPLLDREDARSEMDRTECLGEADAALTDWSRAVWAPFTGPRFLSITVNTSYDCDRVHSHVQMSYLVLDRRSGTAADWSALWPAAEIEPIGENDWIGSAMTTAPAVVDWYRKAVRADPVNEAHWLDVCELPDGDLGQPVVIWLDAERGGIGMDWAFLPHAVRACGSPQIMPIDEAERLGLSPEVAQAVRQGQADRAYRGF